MRLADVLEEALGGSSAVAFRAYDGSVAGPKDAVGVVEVRSPMAMRYVVGSPGDLGLARAYVTGTSRSTALYETLLELDRRTRATSAATRSSRSSRRPAGSPPCAARRCRRRSFTSRAG